VNTSKGKALVQVEALTAYALFQHAFHPLCPANQDVECGQFLLGQGAPAHTQRRAFIESGNKRLDFRYGKARSLGKLDECQLLKDT